jgi:hypothetical protein
MKNANIANQLGKNLFLTFIISSFLSFLAIEIMYSKETSSLEGNAGVAILIISSVFWLLMLTISSLTIFLNLSNNVRKNGLYISLSFFVLPLLLTLVAALYFIKNDFKGELNAFIVATILYFLTLEYFFIKFIKKINTV